MSRHIGIVAVTAEGAALCYRTICAEGQARLGAFHHPEITMHTLPLQTYHFASEARDWRRCGELLLMSARVVADAGADFAICPDNTVHQGLDLVRESSPLPLLHIAEEVISEAQARGYKHIGILGTRPLMEGPVYTDRCRAAGIIHSIPPLRQRQVIDRIIREELVPGQLSARSREFLQEVIVDLRDGGCDAIALACTELPLLVTPPEQSVLPLLDSTRILARAALREACAND